METLRFVGTYIGWMKETVSACTVPPTGNILVVKCLGAASTPLSLIGIFGFGFYRIMHFEFKVQ